MKWSESMPSAPTDELREFVSFAAGHLANGGSQLTPEEVLDLWRSEHPAEETLADSVEAIQRALEQADRGEGVSLEEFDRRFRARHDLPDDE
jgi:hypothetical protein